METSTTRRGRFSRPPQARGARTSAPRQILRNITETAESLQSLFVERRGRTRLSGRGQRRENFVEKPDRLRRPSRIDTREVVPLSRVLLEVVERVVSETVPENLVAPEIKRAPRAFGAHDGERVHLGEKGLPASPRGRETEAFENQGQNAHAGDW